MLTYRSRNRKSSMDLKNSSKSNTLKIEDKIYPKNKILTNLTEYAGEARTIIQYNNLLKQEISTIKKNNLYLKKMINKIITINKDIKFKLKKNTNNIHLYKDNLFYIVKEYNDLIKKNNNILKEKIKTEKEKVESHRNNLDFQINDLNEKLEESINKNFMLENKNKYKDNFILELTNSYENIGCIQEITRYIYANEEMNQNDIDKYYSKHLAVFQQSLLNFTQSWNKYKNRAIKFEQEIEDLQNILENPDKLDRNKNKLENSEESKNITTENDLFLLTFDEFEDDSREITLETENEDNNGNNALNNSKNNYIKINNYHYNKINPNIKYSKISKTNNAKNQNLNQNNRRINRINLIKRDIYYIPQKDFSRSLIKNSESLRKVITKDNFNFQSQMPKSNRNVSINSVSKLNLKQIVFNKKNKFIKEDEKEMALKRYKIENEYKMFISNNKLENPNELKIQMEIKELKKDINRFKEKIQRKKKIIKEFKYFCKDILKKYNIYMNNKDCANHSKKMQ